MEKWQELIVFIDRNSDFNSCLAVEKFFKEKEKINCCNDGSGPMVKMPACGAGDASSILAYRPLNLSQEELK